MKLKRIAVAAIATGALALVGCGSPDNATSPPAKGSSGSPPSQTGSAGPASGPSAKGHHQKSGTPSHGTTSTTSGGSSSGHQSKKGPGGSSDASGQKIDSQADENAQPTKKGEQTAVLNRVPGKKSDTCVAVGSERDLRAGDFMAGPFDTARAQYGHTQPGATKRSVRLYFVPLHAKTMPGLKLTFTQPTSGTTVVARQKQVADAEQWRFYDTTTVLKQPGRWQVRATAGPDKGCFSFVLPKR